MSAKSATRLQLETSVRALLPRPENLARQLHRAQSSTAGVGVGALVTGYLWGRVRGWRARRR